MISKNTVLVILGKKVRLFQPQITDPIWLLCRGNRMVVPIYEFITKPQIFSFRSIAMTTVGVKVSGNIASFSWLCINGEIF